MSLSESTWLLIEEKMKLNDYDSLKEIYETNCEEMDKNERFLINAFMLTLEGNLKEADDKITMVEENMETKLYETRGFLMSCISKPNEAYDYFKKAEKLSYRSKMILYYVCMVLKKFDEAGRHLLEIEMMPESDEEEIRNEKATYYKCINRNDLAAQMYDLQNDAIQSTTTRALGGNKDDITSAIKKLKKHKTSKDAYISMAQLYMELSNWKKAKKLIKQAMKMTTNPNTLIPLMALCEIKMGNFKSSLKLLKQCHFDFPVVHDLKACALSELKEHEKAAKAWLKGGNNLMAAESLFTAGKTELAKKILLELEEDGNDDPLLFYLLGEIYRMNKNEKMAKKYKSTYLMALHNQIEEIRV